MFRHACAMGLEGIVSKADEPLQVGRVQELAEGEEPGLRAANWGVAGAVDQRARRTKEVAEIPGSASTC